MSARTFSFFILKLMLRRIKNDIYRIQSSRLQFAQPSAGAERLFRQLVIELRLK